MFDLTRSGLEPMVYHTRGEHSNHYTNDAVLYYRKIYYIVNFVYKNKMYSIKIIKFINESNKGSGTFVMEIEFESVYSIDDCHHRCLCVIDLAVVRCTTYSVMKCWLLITSVLFYWWSDRFCFLCFSFFVFVFVLSSLCVCVQLCMNLWIVHSFSLRFCCSLTFT